MPLTIRSLLRAIRHPDTEPMDLINGHRCASELAYEYMKEQTRKRQLRKQRQNKKKLNTELSRKRK